ncbi:MAG: diversity-generating retroelement protein Avd [Patescibacteria group bacterium]|jgi:four helix bundle protein
MQNEAPIILKTYDLYKSIHVIVRLFPREEKYTLGEKIKEALTNILELFIEAEFCPKNLKGAILEKASVRLDFLKLLIRMSYDLKLINEKRYISIEENLQEIGKMLGGWLRSYRNT